MRSICLVVQGVYDTDPRVRRKAEALVGDGYSVDVLALRAPGGRTAYALNGVNIRTVALAKKRGSLSRYFFEYALFFLWVSVRAPLQMWKRRYAAIDVNSLPDFLVFAPFVARLMGARLILDLHEITPEFYMSKYRIAEGSRTVRILKYLEKISVDFADRVITISEPVLDLLAGRGLPREKTIVMMNAVDEARFVPKAEPSAAIQKSAEFVMMYHGTLTEIYGLDIAIEGFAIAQQEMPGAELWILGSGTESGKLRLLVEKHGLTSQVRLVGQVPPSDIPHWLNQCDAGILPIRRDVFLDFAFPNKLPEFIVSGKAVIVSRLKAIGYYFSDRALGYFEPNNPADLAREMVRMYAHPEVRARLAVKAKEEYIPIRWPVMKERYLDMVGQLTGATRPATGKSQTAAGSISQ
jgi:glycosyltransferase involved in cell wall biosynthesis